MWIYVWLGFGYLLAASLPLSFAVGRNLEYEYALISAGLVILLPMLIGLLLPRENIPEQNLRYRVAVAFDTIWFLILGPAIFLMVPSLFYLIDFCPCSANGTAFWSALQVWPAIAIGHAFFHGILYARTQGFLRRRIAVFLLISSLALILSALLLVWFTPQKRVVSILLGFIHGPIYDDWINVDDAIVAMRAGHLLVAMAIMSLFRHQNQILRFGMAILFAVLAASVTTWTSNQPSVANSETILNQAMRGKIEYGDLVLRFRAASEDSVPPPVVRRIFAEALFHVEDLAKVLGRPKSKIAIYVYPNRELKKLWFGAGETDVTDVVQPSIHINQDNWPHATLRHELVHAIASDFAFYGLGFHPNIAITEGLAVALDPEESDLSLDEQVAAMLHTKKLPDIDQLFGAGFWLEAGPRAYAVAGSLIRFIIRKYGAESIRKLYSGSTWKTSLGVDKSEALRAWQQEIIKVYDKEQFSAYAASAFRSEGTINEVCPHGKADLARSRSEKLWLRLRQPVGWSPDVDYWPWRLSLNPGDESVRLNYWRKEIGEIARSRVALTGRLQVWADVLARGRRWEPQSLEGVELAILESDVRAMLNEREASRRILSQIEEFAAKHQIGRSLQRQVQTRVFVHEQLSLTDSIAWRRYLAGWGQMPGQTTYDEPWMLVYLRIRKLDVQIDSAEYLRALIQIPLPANLHPSFHLEWYKNLARRQLKMGEFADASKSLIRASRRAKGSAKNHFAMLSRQTQFFKKLPENLRP